MEEYVAGFQTPGLEEYLAGGIRTAYIRFDPTLLNHYWFGKLRSNYVVKLFSTWLAISQWLLWWCNWS